MHHHHAFQKTKQQIKQKCSKWVCKTAKIRYMQDNSTERTNMEIGDLKLLADKVMRGSVC